MRALPYGFDQRRIEHGLGQLYFESGVKFLQLTVLYRDLSLSECLYAEIVAGSDLDIQLPGISSREKIFKTPQKIVNAFVVSDDFEVEEPLYGESRHPLEQASLTISEHHRKAAWTISCNWLEKLLCETPDRSTATATEGFSEALQQISHLIEGQDGNGIPTMETLYVENAQHYALLLVNILTCSA